MDHDYCTDRIHLFLYLIYGLMESNTVTVEKTHERVAQLSHPITITVTGPKWQRIT